MKTKNNKLFKDQTRLLYNHATRCDEYHKYSKNITQNGTGNCDYPDYSDQLHDMETSINTIKENITNINSRISGINTEINKGYSTADKHLHVTKNGKSITVSPGNGGDSTISTGTNNTINNIKITGGNSATSITITDNDISFTIKPNGDTNSHTYTIGAIIEAIQELNRRTAFIDSTMTFSDAKNHLDVNNKEDVTGASYQGIVDGLPAATDSH